MGGKNWQFSWHLQSAFTSSGTEQLSGSVNLWGNPIPFQKIDEPKIPSLGRKSLLIPFLVHRFLNHSMVLAQGAFIPWASYGHSYGLLWTPMISDGFWGVLTCVDNMNISNSAPSLPASPGRPVTNDGGALCWLIGELDRRSFYSIHWLSLTKL